MGHGNWQGGEVPAETARIARAVFRKGNPYLRLRDTLGEVFAAEEFRDLFPRLGRPAESPGMLALVIALQYAEGLSDRQAADSVRSRIDWKYLLGLEMDDPGFDFTVLSDFRGRLVAHEEQLRLLDLLLERLGEAGLLGGADQQRSDSTHVLASIRTLNRLELVGETMRHTLEVLAVAHPSWLQARVPQDWFDRYGERFDEYHLPKETREREELALQIGQDGRALLEALREDPAAPRGLPAVLTMEQIWQQQYHLADATVAWRKDEDLPAAAEGLQSPFDPDARWSFKRSVQWTGYKVHLTESCAADHPHLITDVQTTGATVPDVALCGPIQEALVGRGLTPRQHWVDAGYPDADTLLSAAALGIDIIGPVAQDTSWQGRDSQAYDLSHFTVDWSRRQVRCPEGKRSRIWSQSKDSYGHAVTHVQFRSEDCQDCPARERCTRGRGPRTLKLRPQPQHEALQRARTRQTTPEFWKRYAKRAGIEGTISQGVRAFDLRRSRYRGLTKAALHNVLVAVAINLTRTAGWLAGLRPKGTRRSPFLALKPVQPLA